jgi:hypothetical protein
VFPANTLGSGPQGALPSSAMVDTQTPQLPSITPARGHTLLWLLLKVFRLVHYWTKMVRISTDYFGSNNTHTCTLTFIVRSHKGFQLKNNHKVPPSWTILCCDEEGHAECSPNVTRMGIPLHLLSLFSILKSHYL